jgi:hypothetical protein
MGLSARVFFVPASGVSESVEHAKLLAISGSAEQASAASRRRNVTDRSSTSRLGPARRRHPDARRRRPSRGCRDSDVLVSTERVWECAPE